MTTKEANQLRHAITDAQSKGEDVGTTVKYSTDDGRHLVIGVLPNNGFCFRWHDTEAAARKDLKDFKIDDDRSRDNKSLNDRSVLRAIWRVFT